MSRVWEWASFEDGSVLTASIGMFGRITVTVDGRKIRPLRAGFSMKSTTVKLRSTEAVLHYGTPAGIGYRCELRVDGKLLLPTQAPGGSPTALTQCPSCKAALRQGDSFCETCGEALPSPDALVRQSEVAKGNSVVGGLSGLFLFSGAVMYLAQRRIADEALRQIAHFSEHAPVPRTITGVAATTIGELRSQIEWEATSVLVVNLVLAALMFGLWRWGKRKPGPAIIVAFCTFIVVQVTNAALDPATIGQGWIVKFIVVVYLVRGLKAALAERSASKVRVDWTSSSRA